MNCRCGMIYASVLLFARFSCLSIKHNNQRRTWCNLEVERHLWRKWKIESMNGELELQLTRFSREAGYAIARKMVAVKCIHDAKHAHVTDPPKPDTRFIWEVNTCQRINCTPFMTISAFVFFFSPPSLFQLFESIFILFHFFFYFAFAFIHFGFRYQNDIRTLQLEFSVYKNSAVRSISISTS